MLIILGFNATISALIQWIDYAVTSNLVNYILVDLFTTTSILILLFIANKKGLLTTILLSIVQLSLFMKMLLLSSIWISAMLASLFSHILPTYFGSSDFSLIIILAAILIILIGIFCPLLVISNISNLYLKNLSITMEKQIRIQLEHYEISSKTNEEIRRFKHDYKNLMVALSETLKRGDFDSALSIINTGEMMLTEPDNTYDTGSVILDALLSEKQLAAMKINSSLSFKGSLPENLLNPVDLCIIFGNALDNAIEACAKIELAEKKDISISALYKNGFLFIKIQNPDASDIKIVNNFIETTKDDKHLHGIGLRSIKASIKKFSGEMKLSSSDGIFILEIDLDFNMKQKN